MLDYKIRKALPRDLAGVYAVFSQADILHRETHPEIFQEAKDIADIKAFFLAGIEAEDAAVLVADASGEIVGAIIAWVRRTPEIPVLVPRTYLSIDNLVVAAEYHQQGIGRALMESLHEWARERDLKDIHLTVWDFNESGLAFYRKLGYEMLHHHMRKELP